MVLAWYDGCLSWQLVLHEPWSNEYVLLWATHFRNRVPSRLARANLSSNGENDKI